VKAKIPFIHVRLVAGRPQVDGLPQYRVGRRDAHGMRAGFAAWRWDGAVLTVENCRYGIRPLYYYVGRDEICLSTSIEVLRARGAPTELDVEALSLFLRLSWFPAEDTPFKAIRIVPPAARFRWNGQLTLDGGLRLVPANGLSRVAAQDELIARFRRAVERDYVDGGLLPLSGGRDSRNILFELCRIGRPRLCVTVKDAPPWPNPNDNTLLARQLTAMFGIEHAVLDYIPDFVAAERAKNALTNLCSLEHSWYMPVHDRLAREPDRVFDGLAGDYLSAGGGLDPKTLEMLEAGRIDDLATHLLTRRQAPGVEFMHDEKQFPFEAAQARLKREFERHLGAVNPIGSYFFWNRVRRGIGSSSFGIMAARDVCVPFLDHDVFDLLTGLPSSMYADRKFHTETINRAFPQYAHIPFEGKKKTPPSNPRGYLLRNRLKLLGHALRRGRGVLDLPHIAPRMLAHALYGAGHSAWYDSASIYMIQLAETIARYQLSTRDGTRASAGCSSL
jgi:asparagine synthetase B (glutamine-hydrolysing)